MNHLRNIAIGQRVQSRTTCWTVVAARCTQTSGVVPAGTETPGGGAVFDLLSDTGIRVTDVPERIVRSEQWTILDEVVGTDIVASTVASIALVHELRARSRVTLRFRDLDDRARATTSAFEEAA